MGEDKYEFTPLTILARTTRQKISKEIEDLNSLIDQVDMTDTHGTLHPIETEHVFFFRWYGIFSSIYHIPYVKHKLNLYN